MQSIGARSMQGSKMYSVPSLRDSALEILEFNVPFSLGKTCHYFKRCDLFHSFHAVVEVQFGGLVRLDRAANNYKENLNSLYRHPDFTLTIDKALRNIIVSAYSHYIYSWPMNGACVGPSTILMRSMLQFAMHYCQKILRCLDMRVMDGDLIVPTCLRMPMLILLARRFVQLYYDAEAQGQYASDFPTRGQGFLQPRGDIRMSIVPRNFRILPDYL